MEILAIEGGVIHGGEGDFAPRFADLGGIAVDARSGGHVEALVPLDEIGVVDLDEAAFVFTFEGGAGGAVGLVADDEVEGWEVVLGLGAVDYADGVIGGEHHGDVACVVPLGHGLGQTGGVGGGRVAEFMGEGLYPVVVFVGVSRALLADFAIGADREAVERGLALLGPFGEGLGEEGEAQHQEEHPLAGTRHGLGDIEGGEGLAGAAGHSELAAVGLAQAGGDVLEGVFLVGTKLLFGF
uniref:Uncharacterized protein n=1 Tax=Candidatus Kentrum sp. LPFa TaxID=2126335 RepID=A0A450W858_9GAMM|nr:MAG: hypothetical protein BECKLPF1236A_GA0070988_100844 [Candidatus Kentron sp. LPFa]VFK24465.1 MAG: hypothetical protein BECKLPF1236C_GA0070990_1001316 [Candidatus Kentron sp. LPFa]